MSVIDISNIINVNVSGTPSGLSDVNMNSVLFLTNETPSNVDPFRLHLGLSEIATDYGTGSETYKMSSALFAQSPNILSGAGRLVIAPMQAAVSATSGFITTANISANLAALVAVTNGDLKVTLNGTAINLTGVSFAGATTLADVAKVLQSKLPNAIVTATSTTITFTSKKVGTISTVALAAVSGGSGTDLAGAGLINAAAASATAGTNSTGETIEAARARLTALVQFVGYFTNLHVEDAKLEAASDDNQVTDNLFVHHLVSTEDLAGIATTIRDSGNFKTKLLAYTIGKTEANLMKAAYVGRAFSVNFAASNSAITMELKALATITPDNGFNQTTYTAAKTTGVDLYPNFPIPAVESNAFNGNGDFFDDVYNKIWLKFALQTAGFNYLATTNTKIAQTETGMTGLKDVFRTVLRQGVNAGVIGVGLKWNNPSTFGNPESLKANITQQGFYIYSLPIADQSQSDRNQRKAPIVQIAVKFSGAIHHSDVEVSVEK